MPLPGLKLTLFRSHQDVTLIELQGMLYNAEIKLIHLHNMHYLTNLDFAGQ
jgi:hypothetical protein